MTKEEFMNLKGGEKVMCQQSMLTVMCGDKPVALLAGSGKNLEMIGTFKLHDNGYQLIRHIEGFRFTTEIFPYSDFNKVSFN